MNNPVKLPNMLESATDDELIEIGMDPEHGTGGLVEAMRRLRVQIEHANSSSERYVKRLLWLTIILVILTVVLVVLTTLLAFPSVADWQRR